MDCLHKRTFAVALNMAQLVPAGTREALQFFHDLLQTPMSVLFRFPATKQIEIRTIQYEYICHCMSS
jgi:hypothetical protein